VDEDPAYLYGTPNVLYAAGVLCAGISLPVASPHRYCLVTTTLGLLRPRTELGDTISFMIDAVAARQDCSWA
jgi:hypothetical protein